MWGVAQALEIQTISNETSHTDRNAAFPALSSTVLEPLPDQARPPDMRMRSILFRFHEQRDSQTMSTFYLRAQNEDGYNRVTGLQEVHAVRTV